MKLSYWVEVPFFEKNVFIDFLQVNNINVANGKTQHNCILSNQTVTIHGNPTSNHHDWVIAVNDGRHILCHILCFLNIQQIDTALQFQIGHLNQPGLYAACHFVDQDVFSPDRPESSLYGNSYNSIRVNGNCSLIHGWTRSMARTCHAGNLLLQLLWLTLNV